MPGIESIADLTPFSVLALAVLYGVGIIRADRKSNGGISMDAAFKAFDRNTAAQTKTVEALGRICTRLEIQDKDHERIVEALGRIEAKIEK